MDDIKRIVSNEYIYEMYYDRMPYIKIYKDKKIVGTGRWWPMFNQFYYFMDASSNGSGYVDTIGRLFMVFNKRLGLTIPEGVEKYFNSLFILCKLNDFNEL